MTAAATASSDDALAERFRAGDPEALRDLYRDIARPALAVAHRVCGSKVLAEEALQQGMLQAWRSRSSLDPAKGFRPWVFTIVKRAAIDVARRESIRAHRSLDAPDAPTLPSPDGTDALWTTWEVRKALDALPVDEREAVRLQHFDGLTHVEIAARLGVPLGTVKSRISRAHRRLADALRPTEGG